MDQSLVPQKVYTRDGPHYDTKTSTHTHTLPLSHTHTTNYQSSSLGVEYVAVFGCAAENSISILYSVDTFELSTENPSITSLTDSRTLSPHRPA